MLLGIESLRLSNLQYRRFNVHRQMVKILVKKYFRGKNLNWARKMSNDLRKIAALSSALILSAAIFTVILRQSDSSENLPEELLSPLEVGRYAVRAERQSQDYDQKAERQIAFATDNDNAATSERMLAAKEEKRARDSAYLAADIKSRIDKILEAGRDQVASAVGSLLVLIARSH